jgi:GPH family glycoside/pentoside/hexuronide:cation symporter
MERLMAVSTETTPASASGRVEPGFGKMIAYGAANFPTGFLLLAVGIWLMRVYCPNEPDRPTLVSPLMFGAVSFGVMLVAGFTDFLVGFWSDRARFKSGRRQPFIRWGLPFMAVAFLLVWFPLDPTGDGIWWIGESTGIHLNGLWLALMLGMLYVSFTVVVNPWLALMPEVWQDEHNRVRVSAWMTAFNSLAQIFGFAGFGAASFLLAGGGQVFGIHFADGFKLAGAIGAVMTVVFFLPTLWVKEPPHSADKEVPYNLLQASVETLKNPAFLPYIISGSLMAASYQLIMAALPYISNTTLVDDPADGDIVAGVILVGLALLTAAWCPLADTLAHRFKKKTLYLISLVWFAILLPFVTLVGHVDFVSAKVHMAVICFLLAPGMALSLIIPRTILADVMDHDIQRTGFRREAMYNGMEGLLQKIAMGLVMLVLGALFQAFGYSEESPLGIILSGVAASIFALLGMIAFLFYPLDK